MPASATRPKRGTRSRALAVLAYATLAQLGACSPRGTTIAEESATDGGAGGAGDAGSRGARGRVQIVAGELVTDRGSRLRGVTVGSDVGLDFEIESEAEAARPLIRSFFERMALEAGLNAVHVYLENEQSELGSAMAFGDMLADESERAGLYLILGLGGGSMLGNFDTERTRDFWNLYGPHYRDREHVLYELHNGPERVCDAPFDEATIAFEIEIYGVIRQHAPDTHVILLSYLATPTDAALAASIASLAPSIDFGNASIGFHAMPDCRPILDIPMLMLPPEPVVALLVTELPPTAAAWPDATTAVEARGLGWMSFHWLRFNSKLSDFVTGHNTAGIRWCPDFGTWPIDSATCE